MQSIEKAGLNDLDHALSDLLDDFPEMRRELHEELGAIAKREVDAAVESSGINDSGGNIRRWQVVHIGSKGGYAAVRAAGAKAGGGTGSNSAGAVTNYLEHGHKIRPPQGGKNYRPRIHVAYVNGFHFYDTARTSVEAKAIQTAQRFTERLANRLEGGR